jgi:hypothetical protein
MNNMDEKKDVTIYMTASQQELEYVIEYLKTIGLEDDMYYEIEEE